jgi:Xaa-Pro aminopeptidase
MQQAGLDLALISDNANKYYLTGRVFSGWILVGADASFHCYVKRPNHLSGDNMSLVRKPEEMTSAVAQSAAQRVGLEMSTLSVNDYNRLAAIFSGKEIADLSAVLRQTRAVKTPFEIEQLRISGQHHEKVYRLIPDLYRQGMTDIQLQIEIERQLRLEGCLGQFRISGDSMELFMANILAGDNADNPTPYDFAMGGAGADASLPVGANNTAITDGMTVMVDANGNFTGYMTDMTRTFSVGQISDTAIRAHQCSIDICDAIAKAALPGTKASDLYELARKMADDAGLADYFMGHHQKAGFIGHGIGIEINEAPVIAPRSRDIIQQGNVIAIEPKFVIPGIGAVGIENTYVSRHDGLECLTNAPQQLISL